MSEHLINATPTKEFFIDMIVRDIPLHMAILDLIDNSIDSAYQKSGSADLTGFSIKISCTKDEFVIKDNCAGFDIETAENYVFRFGSNNKTETTKSSIGQFGIGLKRTIFKMGNIFRVDSNTSNTSLTIEDNISNWSHRTRDIIVNGIVEQEDDWHFKFSKRESDIQNQNTGTTIRITELFPNIVSSFSNKLFITKLSNEIKIAHMVSLNSGLNIELEYFDDEMKKVNITPDELSLINNDYIKPINHTYDITLSTGDVIKAHMYVGIINRDFNKSGVFIFCNNRTILHANKDSTIWNVDVIGKNWHHNYALFCAYIFLESEKTSVLPWTTTKEGVDEDSEAFHKLSSLLNIVSEPVLNFLRKGAHERDNYSKNKYINMPIYDAIESSSEVGFRESPMSTNFYINIAEALENETFEVSKRIQYDMPEAKIQKLKTILGVEHNYEVGIETFKRVYNKLVLGK
ncbi:MAG: ATP-binding protein [Aliarcobacter sp.]|nr:ATP-binding protein [Aliarcobacter sp.]